MAVFQYTVRDATGNMRTGTSEAENPEILKRRLQEQGFVVSDVKQTAKSKKRAGGGWGRVKLKDLWIQIWHQGYVPNYNVKMPPG